jgi:hypothetical protein
MDKATARTKRGQTSRQDDSLFSTLSNQELLDLINDVDAQKRTSEVNGIGSDQTN